MFNSFQRIQILSQHLLLWFNFNFFHFTHISSAFSSLRVILRLPPPFSRIWSSSHWLRWIHSFVDILTTLGYLSVISIIFVSQFSSVFLFLPSYLFSFLSEFGRCRELGWVTSCHDTRVRAAWDQSWTRYNRAKSTHISHLLTDTNTFEYIRAHTHTHSHTYRSMQKNYAKPKHNLTLSIAIQGGLIWYSGCISQVPASKKLNARAQDNAITPLRHYGHYGITGTAYQM